MKRILLAILVLVVIALGVFVWRTTTYEIIAENTGATNFWECLRESGSTLVDRYPKKCKTVDGKTFTVKVGNMTREKNVIFVENPKLGATVASPLTVKGKARGAWYSQGSFHVLLLDSGARTVAVGNARAQKSSTTESFVPFQAVLEFEVSTSTTASPGEKGTLVLIKANPGGLPENDGSIQFSVVFATSTKEVTGTTSPMKSTSTVKKDA